MVGEQRNRHLKARELDTSAHSTSRGFLSRQSLRRSLPYVICTSLDVTSVTLTAPPDIEDISCVRSIR